jgi:hypothetical protein
MPARGAARRRADAVHHEFPFDGRTVGGEPDPGRGQHFHACSVAVVETPTGDGHRRDTSGNSGEDAAAVTENER